MKVKLTNMTGTFMQKMGITSSFEYTLSVAVAVSPDLGDDDKKEYLKWDSGYRFNGKEPKDSEVKAIIQIAMKQYIDETDDVIRKLSIKMGGHPFNQKFKQELLPEYLGKVHENFLDTVSEAFQDKMCSEFWVEYNKFLKKLGSKEVE